MLIYSRLAVPVRGWTILVLEFVLALGTSSEEVLQRILHASAICTYQISIRVKLQVLLLQFARLAAKMQFFTDLERVAARATTTASFDCQVI